MHSRLNKNFPPGKTNKKIIREIFFVKAFAAPVVGRDYGCDAALALLRFPLWGWSW